MTLQYRIRPKHADQVWRQRVYLCEQLFAEAYERWCHSDGDFPTRSVVAAVLYLFSPRCSPFDLFHHRLGERLAGTVGLPEDEYRSTWPKRNEAQAAELIAAMSRGVELAAELWSEGNEAGPSAVALADFCVSEIVARQYVIFHHYETTRRDLNHWGI